MAESDADWFYAQSGSPQGPLKFAALRQRLRDASLPPDTLVWRKGLPQWMPAHRVPGLLAAGSTPLQPPRLPTPAATPEVAEEPPKSKHRSFRLTGGAVTLGPVVGVLIVMMIRHCGDSARADATNAAKYDAELSQRASNAHRNTVAVWTSQAATFLSGGANQPATAEADLRALIRQSLSWPECELAGTRASLIEAAAGMPRMPKAEVQNWIAEEAAHCGQCPPSCDAVERARARLAARR